MKRSYTARAKAYHKPSPLLLRLGSLSYDRALSEEIGEATLLDIEARDLGHALKDLCAVTCSLGLLDLLM